MPGKTRPTYGATRVADLIDTVTKSYDKLRKFSHKMRFLIEIQAEILDQYQGRLSESLDAYQTITNPVARTLHGVSKEQQAELEGIRGIESLCKVYGSAEYIINVLHEWSDSEVSIFLTGYRSPTNLNDCSSSLTSGVNYSHVQRPPMSTITSLAQCLIPKSRTQRQVQWDLKQKAQYSM